MFRFRWRRLWQLALDFEKCIFGEVCVRVHACVRACVCETERERDWRHVVSQNNTIMRDIFV